MSSDLKNPKTFSSSNINQENDKEAVTHWLQEVSPFIKQLQNEEDQKRQAHFRNLLSQ